MRSPLISFLLRPCSTQPSITPILDRASYFSSSSSPSSPPRFSPSTYLPLARQKLLSQPSTLIPDVLSPTPSHLLTLSLADHCPSLFPANVPAAKTLPSTLASPPQDLVLPQGHHLVYFPLQLPPSKLMADGTDPGHCPGAPFVRRMWAGGEVVFHPGWERDMRVDGRRAACVETVGEPVLKEGKREGEEKVFVEVRRSYGVGERGGNGEETMGDEGIERKVVKVAGPVVEEVRRLVFMRERDRREEMGVGGRVIKSSTTPEFAYPLKPDATLLFHFSALTYNAHAIHLDPDYARNVEGYKERLVHGPLTLVLMLSALRASLAQLQSQTKPGTTAPPPPPLPPQGAETEDALWMPYVKSLNYRNLAPLYVNEEMKICLRRTKAGPEEMKWDVWIEGPEGGLAVKGQAVTTGVSQAT
ncbi:hypothetical protein VTI74DRAFT_3307 [Chaetomium olivicolor]